MPFDPKLIPPDDAPLRPDGEIDLPAELAALGEQLRDDAQHLAKRYPAARDGAAPVAIVARARARSWGKVAVLAASAAATVLAGVVALQIAIPQKATPSVAERPDSAGNNAVVAPEAVPAAGESIGSPTTVSLTELSGPELEALIDLWQREPSRAEGTGISF